MSCLFLRRMASAWSLLVAVSTSLAVAAGPPAPRATTQEAGAASPVALAPVAAPSSRSTASNGGSPQRPPANAQPKFSTAPDAEIERTITARFASSKISSDGFKVHVQGGVAVLEGKTSIIQHKGTATRLAKRAGARRVDNRIQISEEARQRAAAQLASGLKPRIQVSHKNN